MQNLNHDLDGMPATVKETLQVFALIAAILAGGGWLTVEIFDLIRTYGLIQFIIPVGFAIVFYKLAQYASNRIVFYNVKGSNISLAIVYVVSIIGFILSILYELSLIIK